MRLYRKSHESGVFSPSLDPSSISYHKTVHHVVSLQYIRKYVSCTEYYSVNLRWNMHIIFPGHCKSATHRVGLKQASDPEHFHRLGAATQQQATVASSR